MLSSGSSNATQEEQATLIGFSLQKQVSDFALHIPTVDEAVV